MLEKNLNVWLTTSKKRDDIQYTQKYPEIPESKKDTRKYPIVYFNTPAQPEPSIFTNTLPNIEKSYLLGTE